MKFVIEDIAVEVERKRMKNILLTIKRDSGGVHISAPYHITNDEIYAFISSRLSWIRKHQAKLAIQASDYIKPQKYISGEKLLVWGEERTLEIQEGSQMGLWDFLNDRVVLPVPFGADIKKRKELLQFWYEQELKLMLPSVVAKVENKTGLHVDNWKIKKMKSAWGICKPSDSRISINVVLAQFKPVFLEYIVTHELLHLLELNHGERFKAHMDEYFPNWRETRQELNKYTYLID